MKVIFSLLIAAGLFSCDNNKSNSIESIESITGLPPVETNAANTNYVPAFEGQTRVAGVKTRTVIESTVLSTGLTRPWGITPLPDGRLLITQKEGTMRMATTTGTLSEPITGIPAVNAAGQGGLLGLTIDPLFQDNRMVYWTFSESGPEGNVTAVAKGRLATDERTIENATVIYRATPGYQGTLHYGSRILFDRTGHLVFSTGERSDLVIRAQAQQLNSSLGKVIRITTSGAAASGNPLFGGNGARPELYSYGHRNVQGLAMHPTTGDIWENEHGPRGGDELNRLTPGKNYGWPVISYGIEYSGQRIGEGITQRESMEQPVYYWDPVIAPGGMTFYDSDVISEWKNNLFIASLGGQHIARLIIKDNKVTGEERLLESEGQRFRDITRGKDGALYAISDAGKLYCIKKK
ncbi:MAG TPA: PQQ-dependent sugar dehydrogenase [Flavobacterium sp.]